MKISKLIDVNTMDPTLPEFEWRWIYENRKTGHSTGICLKMIGSAMSNVDCKSSFRFTDCQVASFHAAMTKHLIQTLCLEHLDVSVYGTEVIIRYNIYQEVKLIRRWEVVDV